MRQRERGSEEWSQCSLTLEQTAYYCHFCIAFVTLLITVTWSAFKVKVNFIYVWVL